MRLALAQNSQSLQWAPEELKDREDIVRLALSTLKYEDPGVMCFASARLQKLRSLAVDAIDACEFELFRLAEELVSLCHPAECWLPTTPTTPTAVHRLPFPHPALVIPDHCLTNT